MTQVSASASTLSQPRRPLYDIGTIKISWRRAFRVWNGTTWIHTGSYSAALALAHQLKRSN